MPKAGKGGTRENVKFVADLKLKFLVFSNVSVVNYERLLGLGGE